MRVGIYSRISSDTEGLGLGVGRQEDDARTVASLRGWDVACVYQDNDYSAFNVKVKRPEFERLLADLERGTVDGVVAYDLDRFSRQPADLERAIRIFDTRPGLVFATVQQDLDLSTSDGRTMARVMVAFANKSSMDTSRRIKRKNLELAQRGVPRSTRRPFGYEDDKVTIRPAEAELVRQAARDVLAGVGLHTIARRWNEQGVRTPYGNQWLQSVLKAMLVSPRMAGFRIHQKQIARDADGRPVMTKREPLMDVSTWESVCAVLNDPERTRRHTYPGGRKRLLSGLVRCGTCGVSMSCDALGKDRLPCRIQRRPRQLLALSARENGLYESHLRRWDPRFKTIRVQLSSAGVVTAPSSNHFRVGADEEIEALIGGMTAPPVKICVLDDQ